jgi:hypothetical protein
LIGIVVSEFFSLLLPSSYLHNVSGFLTSKIRWKCMYGTPIQPVETMEHLIFNHPIDNIPSARVETCCKRQGFATFGGIMECRAAELGGRRVCP